MDGQELTPEEKQALAEIRRKKTLLIQEHRVKKSTAAEPAGTKKIVDKEGSSLTQKLGTAILFRAGSIIGHLAGQSLGPEGKST
ncbi:hypothetical protein CJ030_MR1G023271 [Morella rubra]|uniref:Uncharacterized protein n=1 Tax=Morella rubra TaxID=262757 RepID=A0A6A1WVA5_9ROSI|nr:hypothetical protein CJ030_MR1G023271 [Morella rubra]